MFHRLRSHAPALVILVGLPVIAFENSATNRHFAFGVVTKPVSIGVEVTTAIRPLDLQRFSARDFGDADQAH